jgi:hypothetical protein
MRSGTILGALCSTLLLTQPLWAQSRAPEAEALFAEGRALMDRGDYAAACPKLRLSNDLDPARNAAHLAECH